MQSKVELFDKLPRELKIEIARELSTSDLVNLVMTSKSHFFSFQPMIDVRKLLHHTVRGEYEAIQAMLKEDMSLIFKRGKVTDRSGR